MEAMPAARPPDDEFYMRQALALAVQTAALASPNPQVGCVLTRDHQIIGQGSHLYANRDHAEIAALKAAATAGHSTAGATAYVTLEPCSHHGRTGPCADALIAARIARCVIATADPNPQVSGRGIARLRAAGIEVILGPCEAEARRLNEPFALSITRHRPFVHLKSALSTDGMLAPSPTLRTPNQPHWLTGPAARAEVQLLRHAADAILTGIGTVLVDDPALTDRTALLRRRPLLRIVLDPHLRIPLTSKLVTTLDNDLYIFCTESAHASQTEKFRTLQGLGVTVMPLPGPSRFDPAAILAHLHSWQLLSVLLEAGSHLNAAFIQANLVDRATLFYAPTELGPHAIPFATGGPTPFAFEQSFLSVEKHQLGPDVRVSGLINNPWPPALTKD